MSFIGMDILVIAIAYIAVIRNRKAWSIPRVSIFLAAFAALAALAGDLILNWELVIGKNGFDRR